MSTSEITNKIESTYAEFTQYIDSLEEKDFLYTDDASWSAGQQLEHIVKSVVPLNTYMSLPNFTKKLLFGTNKGDSQTYDEIIEQYLALIKSGGKSTKEYIPKDVSFADKENLISKLNYNLQKFLKSLNKLLEKNLDKFRVPHPLLGKLTIREMLYFTDYHCKHHLESIKGKLK
jgi:hypothetical protein